jgi:hypothetical protein
VVKSNATPFCIAGAIAAASLVVAPPPLHGQEWDVEPIRRASPAAPLAWHVFVKDPRSTGLAPGRYHLSLDLAAPRKAFRLRSLEGAGSPGSPARVFEARATGCGAEGFPGRGVEVDDLVLEVRRSADPLPVLMVLANRDFFHHPCRLEAAIPTGSVVFINDRVASGVPAPPTLIDIRDPGRTGLPPGSYGVQLQPPAAPVAPSEVEYYTITLTNARVAGMAPLSYRATLVGCPDPATGGITLWLRDGLTASSVALADGSVRVELGSRAVPGCRAGASIPPLPR